MKGLIQLKENYYEILEISQNASQEIIEKVYKILVKKYHPDLQENNSRIESEEKIKKINEAYDILSNPEKREKYNLTLKNTNISEEDYNKLYNENIYLRNEINYLKNNYINFKKNISNNINDYKKNIINNNINRKIKNDYIQDLKINRYKIKYKKRFKDSIALIITMFIIIIIFYILWIIPFTKNYLINLYNNNSIIKFIVDLFTNFIKK